MSATCGYSENIYSLGVLLLVTHLRHSANATRTRPWRFGGASAVGVPLSVAQSSSARNPRQGRRESPTRSRADPIGSDRSMRFLRAAKIAVLCSAALPQRTGGLPEGFAAGSIAATWISVTQVTAAVARPFYRDVEQR